MAFAALYLRHAPRIRRYIARRVNETHVIDDLTQETFTRALTSLASLRNPQSFYPWLTVVARRLIARHYAARERVIPLAQPPSSNSEPADSDLLRAEDRAEVRQALGQVAPRHRVVLELREGLELSYEDIAQHMDTTTATIPPLLHRARSALRREYLLATGHHIRALLPVAWLEPLRRLRAKLTALPEPALWSGTVAAVVVGVTVGGGAPAPGQAADRPDSGQIVVATDLLHAQQSARAADDTAVSRASTTSEEHAPSSGTTPSERQLRSDLGVTSTEIGGDAYRDGREQDAHMPYQIPVGPGTVSIDPGPAQNRLNDTSRGDYAWTDRARPRPERALFWE